VIEIFLSGIRERSPNTEVSVIMTDDGIVDTIIHVLCNHRKL